MLKTHYAMLSKGRYFFWSLFWWKDLFGKFVINIHALRQCVYTNCPLCTSRGMSCVLGYAKVCSSPICRRMPSVHTTHASVLHIKKVKKGKVVTTVSSGRHCPLLYVMLREAFMKSVLCLDLSSEAVIGLSQSFRLLERKKQATRSPFPAHRM